MGGIRIKKTALRPTESNCHVPMASDSVAGKLRECQALAPRLTMLENQIKQAQQN